MSSLSLKCLKCFFFFGGVLVDGAAAALLRRPSVSQGGTGGRQAFGASCAGGK